MADLDHKALAASLGIALTASTPNPPEVRPEPVYIPELGAKRARALELYEDALRERALRNRRRDADEARASLAEFVRQAWGEPLGESIDLDWNWHIQAICDHIQAVLEGWMLRRIKPDSDYYDQGSWNIPRNLIINVPPGSLKSTILSVCAPAWIWLHVPQFSVLCLSANPEVARRDSDKHKELIRSDWYRETFGIQWDVEKDAVHKWTTTAGGRRLSKGLNAKVTGQRCDAIFIDDPHDAEEANSDKHRERVIKRWTLSVRNRVNDQRTGVRIGIMQRLHEADWAALVIKQGWEHLKIPTEYNPKRTKPTWLGWSDPRTIPNEPIHVERFPPAIIAEEKESLGSYGYAGQHDQEPAPADGGIFKKSWFKMVEPADMPTKFDMVFISVDSSLGSTTETASRNAIGVFGIIGGRRYLLDVFCKVGGLQVITQRIKEKIEVYRPNGCLVELKANGQSIIDQLSTEFSFIVPYDPKRDSKKARAMACAPEVEAGSVYLPKGEDWVDFFKHELAVFPNGAHDDQVDMLSQMLNYLRASPDLQRLIGAFGDRNRARA